MKNLTKESAAFLESINTSIKLIEDCGMHSGVRVTLENGLVGTGYYPAWKPLKLNVNSFK